MNEPTPITFIMCGARCPAHEDGKHRFEGWQEFEDGLGGTTVCKCGKTAFDDSLMGGE